MPRYHAPDADGDWLVVPPWSQVPHLLTVNRRLLAAADWTIDGTPLPQFRRRARAEIFPLCTPPIVADPDTPLLLSGHQPELIHPGVWAKHFALYGLARRLDALPLHLIADSDLIKSTALAVPVFPPDDPAAARLHGLPYDTADGPTPYECRTVRDPELLLSLPQRLQPLVRHWGYEPLLLRHWPRRLAGPTRLGELHTHLRRTVEAEWGCRNHELPVSVLCGTEAFFRFVAQIRRDLPRFRRIYNAALAAYRRDNRLRSRVHPASDLAEGELPFWEVADGQRRPATPDTPPHRLRPRALTLTLFARLVLADWFLHGIGGGKYDEVTDRLIADYCGLEPPRFQVVTATLRLPLPVPPTDAATLRQLHRHWRDLYWNPQRHLPATAPPVAVELARQKLALARDEPPPHDHPARTRWYGQLRRLTEQLRAFVTAPLHQTEQELQNQQRAWAAAQVLRRRDYPWVLYPAEPLQRLAEQGMQLSSPQSLMPQGVVSQPPSPQSHTSQSHTSQGPTPQSATEEPS